MRHSNHVQITGNLGGPVELKALPEGKFIAKLSLAENQSIFDPKTNEYKVGWTNWIPITVFGNLAKRVAKSLKKGDRITVMGEIKTRSYEVKGEKRYGFEVLGDSIEKSSFLAKAEGSDPKKDGEAHVEL